MALQTLDKCFLPEETVPYSVTCQPSMPNTSGCGGETAGTCKKYIREAYNRRVHDRVVNDVCVYGTTDLSLCGGTTALQEVYQGILISTNIFD